MHDDSPVKPVSWRDDLLRAQHLNRSLPRMSTGGRPALRFAVRIFSQVVALMVCVGGTLLAQLGPLNVAVSGRERMNVTEWFSATPDVEEYGHLDSLLRIALQQRAGRYDWQLELGQSAELFLPNR